MLLATYQPCKPSAEKQNAQYDCFRARLGGSYPVFCFPARNADEFRFRSLLAAPVKPERLMLFDTEDFVRFDAVKWNNILCLARDGDAFNSGFNDMFVNVDERFSEYVVSGDTLEQSCFFADNLHELIFDTEIGCSDCEGAAEMFSAFQEWAQEMYADAMTKINVNDKAICQKVDMPSVVELNAFITYLAGCEYRSALGQPISIVDTIPFICTPTDAAAASQWERFGELRWKIFDSKDGGSRQEYIDMCDALVKSLGTTRRMALDKMTGRNDLCVCMSGRKYKNCHRLKPIDIFPFC